MKSVFIIAEVGVNHNGSVPTAKRLIDFAAEAGADAVKFQTFEADSLAAAHAQKANYQKMRTPAGQTQLQMLKELELTELQHMRLMEHCRRRKIAFLSTAFDIASLEMLRRLGLHIFKVSSGDITNLPYLRKLGGMKKKVILSSGMATMREIGRALDVLIRSGTRKCDITVLHCNTEYPTPYEDVNLLAMVSIKNRFGVRVGYSDHTLGIEVPVAAAVLGASVIEKHITLDRDMCGPDHSASLEPYELKKMVDAVRNIEAALGSPAKRPSRSETKNIDVARKSIVAARAIRRGETFGPDNITVKRPGTGLSPMFWDRVAGRIAERDFSKDEFIET
jgi:N,N'-diacetyllegionaminate synthase